MALHGTSGTVGVPLPQITHVFSWLFWVILGGHTSDMAHPKYIILFANVTLLNDAVTSYVTSRHHMCIGHMTFYYKRLPMPQWRVLACCLSIHQVQLYHQRPACGWCLTHVGCNASGTSLGRSLLPSIVIIVSAFVNSAVSPAGTHKYLNETGECCSTPC